MMQATNLIQPSFWQATAMIATIVLTSSTGEVLTAAAMKSMGDLDDIRARSGIRGAIRAVVTSPLFVAGIFFMAVAFFSLLFALNHMNLSLVGPAAASLTLVAVRPITIPSAAPASMAAIPSGSGMGRPEPMSVFGGFR